MEKGSVCVHTPHIYAHVCIHPYAYRLTYTEDISRTCIIVQSEMRNYL